MEISTSAIFLCLNKYFLSLEQISRVLLVNICMENDCIACKFPVEIFNIGHITNPPLGSKKIDIYVVNKQVVDIVELIESLRNHDRFNPRAMFVFIGKKMDETDIENLSSHYILNIYFINTTNGDISTYYPFPDNIYPSRSLKLEIIGNTMSCNAKTFLHEKIPNDWKSGTLKVCFMPSAPGFINQNEGIFPETFALAALPLNMTLIWKEDYLPIKGFWIQHFHKVFYEGKCDLHMGYLMVENEFLTAFAFDSAYWFVPSPKEIEKWTYAFRVFTRRAWCFWMIFIVLLCVVWGVCNFLLEKNHFFINFFLAMMSLVNLFIEQSQKFLHKFVTLHILMYLMFFLSFLMNMLFKSKFPFLLIGIHYEEINFQDLQDIMDAGITVGVPEYFLQFFGGKPDVEIYLKSHHFLCHIDSICLRRTAFERDLATVQVNMFYMNDRKNLLDANGRELVMKLQPAIVSSTMNAILAKGHPLFKVLDERMQLLWDHGFARKITQKYEHDMELDWKFDLIKLGLGHIMLPLVICLIGVSISLLVFALEIYKSKKSNKNFVS